MLTTQGVAIGLIYIAPSGRTLMFFNYLRPERAGFVSPEQRSGLMMTSKYQAP